MGGLRLILTGSVALLTASCALIGKAQKTVIDERCRKSDGGDYHEEIWSERYVVTAKATSTHICGPGGSWVKPDWPVRAESMSFAWPKGFKGVELVQGTRYRFHLITHVRTIRDSLGNRSYRNSDLERIETLGGAVLLDASRCPVHHVDMRWDWENSGSTEDYFNTPFFEIQPRSFPYDGRVYLPCSSGYYRQKRWICPECESACDQTVKRLGIIRH
jgi:hypothetical protein